MNYYENDFDQITNLIAVILGVIGLAVVGGLILSTYP
mgnify:CR=1 FL=1